MEKLKKWFFFIIYYYIARKLPISNYPGGGLGKSLRYITSKRLFRKCGENVNVERGADFLFGDTIEIGDRSGIGVDAWIRAEIIIGKDVMMGPQVIIYGKYHAFERIDVPMMEQGMAEFRPIVIEDDVWIGARSIILQNLTIGKGAIIAAGSVVTRDVAPYTIVAGNPASLVRHRVKGVEVIDFE